jgi:hypothetical protein
MGLSTYQWYLQNEDKIRYWRINIYLLCTGVALHVSTFPRSSLGELQEYYAMFLIRVALILYNVCGLQSHFWHQMYNVGVLAHFTSRVRYLSLLNTNCNVIGYRRPHSVFYTCLFTTPVVVSKISVYSVLWPSDVVFRSDLCPLFSLSVAPQIECLRLE